MSNKGMKGVKEAYRDLQEKDLKQILSGVEILEPEILEYKKAWL